MEQPPPAPADKKRAVWVDAARCLAMLPILWLHAGDAPEALSLPVGGGICLFFLLAGYFLPQGAGACARRALKLALAWLLWSLISWGLYCLCAPEPEWTWAQVFGWGTAALNTPLWFLRNLFIYQLIIAGLLALRLLPRYKWFLLVLLAGCCYAATPGQHESLRFDWMMVFVLGYGLRGVALEELRGWLSRHALLLLLLMGLWMLQWNAYPDWLRGQGVAVSRCGLPLPQLAWAVCYVLAALGVERCFPRVASLLAMAGVGMLFIYAAHSLLYAPLYAYGIHWAGNVWAPLVALPLLTLLHRFLSARLPRLTRVLCAK